MMSQVEMPDIYSGTMQPKELYELCNLDSTSLFCHRQSVEKKAVGCKMKGETACYAMFEMVAFRPNKVSFERVQSKPQRMMERFYIQRSKAVQRAASENFVDKQAHKKTSHPTGNFAIIRHLGFRL